MRRRSAAADQRTPLIVTDTTLDARFAQNRFVVGEPHIRFYAGFPIYSPDNVCVGTLCAMDTKSRRLTGTETDVMEELSQSVTDLLSLRSLATTDALTGVNNRRGFMNEATRALGLANRHRHDLSVVLFDLDHFRTINDTYGHGCGDAVIVSTLRACERILRSTDVIGRVGGEEFAALLPYTSNAGALALAEDLRKAIDALEFSFPSKVTASFGVACNRGAADFDDMLQAADAALYRAKSAGRNCCLGAGETASLGLGRWVLKAGNIVFNKGTCVLDCTVRRMSETAALLEVISTATVPDQFKLRIDADRFSRMCQITRKAGTHLEVAF